MENPSHLRKQLKAHLEDLARQVDGKAQQQGFQDALRTMALFWRYSPLNQFLIRGQRPNATHVMARLKWEAIGRKVKEGAEPILVLAPTKPGWATNFIGVPVFDVKQTRGRRVAK